MRCHYEQVIRSLICTRAGIRGLTTSQDEVARCPAVIDSVVSNSEIEMRSVGWEIRVVGAPALA